MTHLDNDLISRLVGYRRLDEAPMGQTLAPARASGADSIGAFGYMGRADMPNRLTNNMGDNSMANTMDEEAPSAVIDDAMLDKMHEILNKVGISDHDIALGTVKLNINGASKVTKKLSSIAMTDDEAASFCIEVLNALSQKLVSEVKEDEESYDGEQLDEFVDMPEDSRFTYVTDPMGGITIRDSETGKSIYLHGDDATDLVGELQMYSGTAEKEQTILSQYQHVMEKQDVTEDEHINFGISNPALDILKSLRSDVAQINSKLHEMRSISIKTNDVTNKFAAELFQDEIKEFEHALQEYLAKIEN